MTGVAYGGGVFVAVGWSRSSGTTTARVWTSADGLAWTARPDDAFDGISFEAVAYSGTAGYYTWRVSSAFGAGAYSMTLQVQ